MPNDRQMNLDGLLSPEGPSEQGADAKREGWATKEEAGQYIGHSVRALHAIPENRNTGRIRLTIGPEHDGRITGIDEISPGFFALTAEFIIDGQEGKNRWHVYHTIYRNDLDSSFSIGEKPKPESTEKEPVPKPVQSDSPSPVPSKHVPASLPQRERSPFVRHEPDPAIETAPGELESNPLIEQIREFGKDGSATLEELNQLAAAVERYITELKERSGGTMERKTISDAREGIVTERELTLQRQLSQQESGVLRRIFATLNVAKARRLTRSQEEQAKIVQELSRLSAMAFALFTAKIDR